MINLRIQKRQHSVTVVSTYLNVISINAAFKELPHRVVGVAICALSGKQTVKFPMNGTDGSYGGPVGRAYENEYEVFRPRFNQSAIFIHHWNSSIPGRSFRNDFQVTGFYAVVSVPALLAAQPIFLAVKPAVDRQLQLQLNAGGRRCCPESQKWSRLLCLMPRNRSLYRQTDANFPV